MAATYAIRRRCCKGNSLLGKTLLFVQGIFLISTHSGYIVGQAKYRLTDIRKKSVVCILCICFAQFLLLLLCYRRTQLNHYWKWLWTLIALLKIFPHVFPQVVMIWNYLTRAIILKDTNVPFVRKYWGMQCKFLRASHRKGHVGNATQKTSGNWNMV